MRDTKTSKEAPALVRRAMVTFIVLLMIPLIVFGAYIDKSRFVVAADYYIVAALTFGIVGFATLAVTIDGSFHFGLYELVRNRVGLVRVVDWTVVHCLLVVAADTNRHTFEMVDWLGMLGVILAGVGLFVAELATYINYLPFRLNSASGSSLPAQLTHTNWKMGRVAMVGLLFSWLSILITWFAAMTYPTLKSIDPPDKSQIAVVQTIASVAIISGAATILNCALSMAALYSDEADEVTLERYKSSGIPSERVLYDRAVQIPCVQNIHYPYSWYEVSQCGIFWLEMFLIVCVACAEIRRRTHPLDM
jgi:hypothetical protein